MNPAIGYEFGGALLKAFGLEGRPVDKLVIEVEVGDVIRVYYREFAQRGAVAGAVELLSRPAVKDAFRVERVADVTVQPDCTVDVDPHP